MMLAAEAIEYNEQQSITTNTIQMDDVDDRNNRI